MDCSICPDRYNCTKGEDTEYYDGSYPQFIEDLLIEMDPVYVEEQEKLRNEGVPF